MSIVTLLLHRNTTQERCFLLLSCRSPTAARLADSQPSPGVFAVPLCPCRELHSGVAFHKHTMQRMIPWINSAVWERAYNKIRHEGADLTQAEALLLVALRHTEGRRPRGRSVPGPSRARWGEGYRPAQADLSAALGCPLKAEVKPTALLSLLSKLERSPKFCCWGARGTERAAFVKVIKEKTARRGLRMERGAAAPCPASTKTSQLLRQLKQQIQFVQYMLKKKKKSRNWENQEYFKANIGTDY